MGEARRRGTFETRREQAEERQAEDAKRDREHPLRKTEVRPTKSSLVPLILAAAALGGGLGGRR